MFGSGGGGGQNCQNVSLLLCEPYNFAPALKKVTHSVGGGGGGTPTHFCPTSKKIVHTIILIMG